MLAVLGLRKWVDRRLVRQVVERHRLMVVERSQVVERQLVVHNLEEEHLEAPSLVELRRLLVVDPVVALLVA